MTLTSTLRAQHTEILQLACAALALAPAAASEQGADELRETLDQLAKVLLQHLAIEDEQLYPRLRSSDDRLVANTALRFASEMGGLAVAYQAFDQRWRAAADIAASPAEFRSEFEYVTETLRQRIASEEGLLYMLSDGCNARAG